jgi:hypothetical protein
MARPAQYPENGPNRLFLDVPRSGFHIPLPPECKPAELIAEETVILI